MMQPVSNYDPGPISAGSNKTPTPNVIKNIKMHEARDVESVFRPPFSVLPPRWPPYTLARPGQVMLNLTGLKQHCC